MKDPQHPVGPAFDKARDALSAWRAQQEAALTAIQRAHYEDLKRREDGTRQARARELETTRRQRIDDEKRRLLLHRPDFALRMLPTRAMKERKALERATHTVERFDRREMESLVQAAVARADEWLRQAERERHAERRLPEKTSDTLTEAFRRAARHRKAERDRGPGSRGR